MENKGDSILNKLTFFLKRKIKKEFSKSDEVHQQVLLPQENRTIYFQCPTMGFVVFDVFRGGH